MREDLRLLTDDRQVDIDDPIPLSIQDPCRGLEEEDRIGIFPLFFGRREVCTYITQCCCTKDRVSHRMCGDIGIRVTDQAQVVRYLDTREDQSTGGRESVGGVPAANSQHHIPTYVTSPTCH